MFPLCSCFVCHFAGVKERDDGNVDTGLQNPLVNPVIGLRLAHSCVVQNVTSTQLAGCAPCRVGAVFQHCCPTARRSAQRPLVSQTSVPSFPSSYPRLINLHYAVCGGKRSLSYFWIPWHSRFRDRNRHIWGKIMSALVKGEPSLSRFSPLLLLCAISTAFPTVVVLSHLKRALLLPVFLKEILPLGCLDGSVS